MRLPAARRCFASTSERQCGSLNPVQDAANPGAACRSCRRESSGRLRIAFHPERPGHTAKMAVEPHTRQTCCWVATGWVNGGGRPIPDSDMPSEEELPSLNAEEGNAEAMCCEKIANCWFNAESLWLVGIGGSINDVPPLPSLEAVKFANE